MAKKGKESLLELCSRATVMANNISVRMLEYLSTVKTHPHGFRELAVDFLDICRILWATEAGLMEASRKKNQLPVEMVSELDKKFRQANDDFLVLNQMLLKFLEYEKKGAFGRLQKSWRMMFADADIEKMRESLASSRDALRMSAVVFRWSLGDEKANASVGIGFTGLVAALERMDSGKTTTLVPQLEAPIAPLSDRPQAREESELPPLPPMLPPVSLVDRKSTSTLGPRYDSGLNASAERLDRQNVWRSSSIRSSEMTSPSVARESANRRIGDIRQLPEDDFSDDTAGSKTIVETHFPEFDRLDDKLPDQFVSLKIDPAAAPRWKPRWTSGADSAGHKTALVDAVHQRRHKTVEQLLDQGVRADPVQEANILKQAILNRDTESLRLLLLFGFQAGGAENDGPSPLHVATKVPFVEGAKMLIKYGADPNLSVGDLVSPLALSVTENKPELAQLYLTYGGDPNFIMADGDTALIQAMNKSTPAKLVELVLKYGSDPNAKSGEGKTALFEAIQSSRIDLMTLLLDHGADPNLPGPKHCLWPSTYKPRALRLLLQRGADPKKTPGIMELATSIKNKESISILLDSGLSPNIKKDGIYTPLCSAIRDNSTDLVSLLLSHGADPNLPASEYPAFKCVTHHRTHLLPQLVAAGSDLNNPKGILETAVAHKNKEALMYLLDQGVGLNDRSIDGHTALTTAIRDEQGEIVDLLLAKGADPAIRGQDWPICMAVKRPAILAKLLSHMSNPHAVRGVIEMAVAANEIESVKLLLKAGISVEDKTGGVFSPLTSAIRDHRTEITRFLLDEAGADPNAPGEHLPIIKALRRMRNGDTEILEMLLARGADINKMYRGWNAILQAVENGDASILRLLIEKGGGVDLQQTDESGTLVIDIVKERGWDEAVTLLLGSVGTV